MKGIKLLSLLLVPLACAFLSSVAYADTVTIDLSGATTGTLITATGGSFAGTFMGQTIVGNSGISGSPTGPLTLLPNNTLDVAFWAPGASPAGNSILPESGNQGPLSLLLSSTADALTWTMGYADSSGPITVDLFNASGGLVNEVSLTLNPGYSVYTLSGLGDFQGVTFYNDNDPAGLRFMNFSYVTTPEPGTLALIGCGLFGLIANQRRRRTSH